MHCKTKTRAFTLIEIAVVLFLIGLLASTVALSSRGLLGGATHEETIAQIGSIDADARRLAEQLGRPLELSIDAQGRHLAITDPKHQAPLASTALSHRYDIKNAWRQTRSERELGQQLVVRYEPNGSASDWGLSLHRHGEESTSAVVVLGMTGQVTVWDSDEQVQDILAATQRRNAD